MSYSFIDLILFVIFSRLFQNKSKTKISEGLHTAMYTPTSTLYLDLVQSVLTDSWRGINFGEVA